VPDDMPDTFARAFTRLDSARSKAQPQEEDQAGRPGLVRLLVVSRTRDS
jgi:hypothetical protein